MSPCFFSNLIQLPTESVLLIGNINTCNSFYINNHYKVFVRYIFKLYCVNISIDGIIIIFDQDFGSKGQACSLLLTLDQIITGCSYHR